MGIFDKIFGSSDKKEAKQGSDGSATEHNARGLALVDKKSYDEAIREYWEAVQIRHNDSSAHNGLGMALGPDDVSGRSRKRTRESLAIEPAQCRSPEKLSDDPVVRDAKRNKKA